jgi:hypothetical protein
MDHLKTSPLKSTRPPVASSNEETNLLKLLDTFSAANLGAGDLNTGVNLLTAMACTLANVAPDDGTVVTRDGRPARLGTSLFICGSASVGRVIDEVINEVGRCQSNLTAHLRSYLDYTETQSKKPGAELPPTGPRPNEAEDIFIATQSAEDPFTSTREEDWMRILDEPPTEKVSDLALRPKILVSAAKSSDLHAQLQGLRPGRPLVHLGLGCPGDIAELSLPVTALLEGRYPLEGGCEYIRANMLVTDPMGMIKNVAKVPDERRAWLEQFLWLCDGDAGPNVTVDKEKTAQSSETTTERFRRALGLILARRLNMPKRNPIVMGGDTKEMAQRWAAFLRKMEPRLPGIYFAARSLLDSLLFGLGQMARIQSGLKFSLAGVEALGRFLVRRMANAKAILTHASELAKRQSDIERIVRKLSQGRANARTIYRNLKLTAAQCNEGIRWMKEAGLLHCVNDEFELVQGARLDFKNSPVPLIEA